VKFKTVGLMAEVSLVCSLAAMPVYADEAARIRELERSMQLIEDLSAKVNRLEKTKEPAATASAVPPGEQQARVEALERQVAQLGSGLSRRSGDDGLAVHGFADVGFAHSGEDNPIFGKGKKGFNVGSLDLYLTPQFGDRVRTLLELVFEVDRDGNIATDGNMQFAGSVKLVPVDNAAVQGDFLSKVVKTEPERYATIWTKKSLPRWLERSPGQIR